MTLAALNLMCVQTSFTEARTTQVKALHGFYSAVSAKPARRQCQKPLRFRWLMAFAWALGLVLFSVALLDQLATTAAADSFDQLRVAWAQSLTGGTNYSLADNLVKSRLSNIETTASNYWSSMKKSVGRTTLWSDLTSTNESGQISTAYSRLRSMALAYATYGSTLRSNATLAADIQGGLNWMYSNRYNESLAEYDNWYDW